jgi:lipid-binding SYLF domain-containing protein
MMRCYEAVIMKKNRWIILAFVLVMAADGFNTALADELSDTVDIFAKSDVVKPFLKNSYGYAVFPLVGKGGFVVGSSYGTGQVVAQGKVTGTAKLVKATIGLQAGGQAFSQMFFFQDKRAYDLFTSGSFELGADASAVAITAGAQASAGTGGASLGASAGPATGKQAPTNYHKGMAVFQGGLMYEAAVGGQKVRFEPKK